ncbi:MAG: MlaD family protein [bacterium]
MKLTSSLKVGILTLVAVLIMIVSIGWLKGRSISEGERLTLKFYDIAGLRLGAPVQMMGYRVGQVEEIQPVFDGKESFMNVKIVITDSQTKIPQASLISIQQSGVIGEKFVEITPPQAKIAYIAKFDNSPPLITKDKKVQIFIDGKYQDIGKVISVKVIDARALSESHQKEFKTPFAYEITYMITTTGIIVPTDISGEIGKSNDLILLPLDSEIIKYYSDTTNYTVIEPLRISEFMDVQFQAAKAFSEINNKINTLLSEDVLDDTQITLANIKNVSIAAADAVTKADALINATRGDIEQTVSLSCQLTKEITTLTTNLNSIVGDTEFKTSITKTADSLDTTSKTLNSLLTDKETQETLKYLRETSKNMSELSASVNEIAKDDKFKAEVKMTATNLNQSLNALEGALGAVQNISPEDKQNIQGTLADTAELTKNLKKFSEKLNKRFLLFRLMF